jgi:hypothetical protein
MSNNKDLHIKKIKYEAVDYYRMEVYHHSLREILALKHQILIKIAKII